MERGIIEGVGPGGGLSGLDQGPGGGISFEGMAHFMVRLEQRE